MLKGLYFFKNILGVDTNNINSGCPSFLTKAGFLNPAGVADSHSQLVVLSDNSVRASAIGVKYRQFWATCPGVRGEELSRETGI